MEATQCPSTDEWISKVSHKHTIECYLALKRKEILTYVTTWMNFVRSEISQSQKDKYRMFPLRVVKMIETESRMVDARDWGAQYVAGTESLTSQGGFLPV